MQALWVHDHPFIVGGENQVFSKSGVNYKSLSRYLNYFETLEVTGRMSFSEITENLANCEGPNIHFSLIKGFTTPLQYFFSRTFLENKIEQIIKKVDCCIIIMPSVLGLISINSCIKLKKPYVVQVIGCIWDTLWNYGHIGAKILAPIFYFENRRHIKKSNYVAYITESFLQERYPSIGVIGSGMANVQLTSYQDKFLQDRIKKILLKSKESIFRIGLIGSLNVAYKGHNTSIKSISLLVKRGFFVELHFLGSGDNKKWKKFAKKYQVQDQIYFDGVLPSGEEVMKWLDNLDIYIQPSTSEGHGRSVVEAMSRACPTLASRTGGLVDSLDDKYLFKSRDYIELSKLIEMIICDKEFALNCAKDSFKNASRFTEEKIQSKWDEFFKKFIKDGCIGEK